MKCFVKVLPSYLITFSQISKVENSLSVMKTP